MLLTILIPTRNRVHRVVPLVRMLIDGLELDERQEVEVLVLNNRSDDATLEELGKFASPQVRIHSNADYLPSSEQNVFANLHRVRGKYTWFLGDDDLPRIDAVRRLLQVLSSDVADLIISTFRVIDGEGSIGNVSQVRGAPEDVQTDIVSLVKRIGLINFFSGWSLIVARTSMLDLAVAERISAVNPIYAHCFWLIECFKNARARFQVQPLVDYRIFHQAEGWENYTAERGVGDLYQWGLGLLRLYAQAMDNHVLKPGDISEIYEYRHGGSRYRAVDEIVFKLVEQADFFLKTARDRNLLSPGELEEAIAVVLRIDFSLQDVAYELRELYDILRRPGLAIAKVEAFAKQRGEVIRLLTRRRDDLCQPFFRQYCYGYLIFEFNTVWVAIHADGMHLLEHVFAQFLPTTMPPDVLVAPSREKVMQLVLGSPARPEPVGGRPPFTSMSGEDFVLPRRFQSASYRGGPEDAARVTLLSGWSAFEPHGVWSVGETAGLVVEADGEDATELLLQPFLPTFGERRFQVRSNGAVVFDQRLAANAPVAVALGPPREGGWFVTLICEEAPSPAELGASTDLRRLGMLLVEARCTSLSGAQHAAKADGGPEVRDTHLSAL